ncbi:MAG: response regulator [Eubacterium sp.]|nr:response regulator [Eubacterium sp.]
MKIICVDDEKLILQLVMLMCEQLPQVSEVVGFSSALEALEYLKDNSADIALLDIEMPKMNGITLAVKIKELQPKLSVIFLTGYSHYALDALKIHASGYILKPIEKDRLAEEINYAMSAKEPPAYPHIYAKTFGEFDLLVDGSPVHFPRSKAKELLAYLVDKQGAGVKRKAAFAALYEDAIYDRKMQNSFNVIVHCLKTVLAEHGVGEIFEMNTGELRVNPTLFDCDLYRLLQGDTQAVNAYRGEYMTAYYWANLTESFIDNSLRNE